MSHNKGGNLQTPFTNPHGHTLDKKEDSDDLYERNPTPQFAHAHDMGPDTIPVVFEEGELGKRYFGSIEKEAATIASPMRGMKK